MVRTSFERLWARRLSIFPYEAIGWGILLRIFGALATLLMGILLGRNLGPAGLGQFGLIMAIAVLLACLAQLGLPTLAAREIAVSRMESDWRRVRAVLVSFGAVTTACGILLGVLFAVCRWVFLPGDVGMTLALLCGALLVPMIALVNLVEAELCGLDRLVKGQALGVAVRPALMALLLFVLGMTTSRMSPALALGANLAAFALTLALGLAWARTALPVWEAASLRAGELRAWLRSAAPLALTDLLRQLDGVYGLLVVGLVASNAETGIFRVAASSVVIVAIPNTVMHVLLAPTLARLHAARDYARLRTVLTQSARAMFVSLCAGWALIAVAGQWLIGQLFGEEFRPAWLPLVILIAAHVVNAFFGLGSVLLAMSAAEKALARRSAVAATVSIVAAFPFAYAWGGSGAAASSVLGYLAGNLLVWQYVRRTTGLDCSAIGLAPRAGRH